jgi:hypothetical protein
MTECSECLEEFPEDQLVGGICAECRLWLEGEECDACDGTGYSGVYTDEDGAEDCEECGGEGVL